MMSLGCVPSTDTSMPAWTNLVFEPYVSAGNDAVQSNTWQTRNVAVGNLYSTREIRNGTPLSGYQTFTLAQLKEKFPSAVVVGVALNVGSGNPHYDIRVDAVNTNIIVRIATMIYVLMPSTSMVPSTTSRQLPRAIRLHQQCRLTCVGQILPLHVPALQPVLRLGQTGMPRLIILLLRAMNIVSKHRCVRVGMRHGRPMLAVPRH